MFFFKRKQPVEKDSALSVNERKRLRTIPRYQRVETSVFGTPVEVNDACTLLGDIRELIDGEIYKFHAPTDSPIILDCGANIGMSIVYFKRLYPNSKIIGFEPDPILFSMLSNNISNFAFKNVELHQAAVWVNNEGISFRKEGGHSGRITENDNGDEIVPVSSMRLRDILTSIESVDILKMDIEGAEADVLFDCGKVITNCNHVFIEYHSRADKKQELHDILKMFSELGYRYHVQEAFVRKHPFVDKDTMVDMDLQLNLFFIKE